MISASRESKVGFRPLRTSAVFIALGITFLSNANASSTLPDSSQAGLLNILTHDAGIAVADAQHVYASPFRADGGQWLVAGSLIAGTAVLFPLDESIRSFAQRNHSRLGDDVFGAARVYGNVGVGIGVSAVFYVGGIITENNGLKETGFMMLESLAIAGLTTSVIKSALGRSRPYTGEGPYKYRGFQFKAGTTALPSGHTTVAFALSSVLASRVDGSIAPFILYGAAILTGLSRVYHDDHWMSDSYLGAVVGTSSGLVVVRLHQQCRDGIDLGLRPTLDGLNLRILF